MTSEPDGIEGFALAAGGEPGDPSPVRRISGGWVTVVGSSILGGAFYYLLMTVAYPLVLGERWDWSRAVGGAIALTLVWTVIGATTQRRSSRHRGTPDQQG